MKTTLSIFALACILSAVACKDIATNKSDSAADTAVLVKDPENTLNAKPVNDTVVHMETADTTTR